jgi:peptidoglycan/xylan/chitin deacetylase (PgdA/CDA1 family)
MKRLIASVANHSGLVDAYSCLRRLATWHAAILFYHRVGYKGTLSSLSQRAGPEFESQIRYLSKAYEVLPLDKLAEYVQGRETLPRKAVAITFDDGYKDNYIYAYPILKKYGVPATIFLTTGYIDSGNLFWFDKVTYVIQNTCLKALELGELGTYSLRSNSDRLQAISRITARLKELLDERKNLLVKNLVRMSGVDIPANLGKEVILSWDQVREMSDNGIAFGAHSVTHPILTKMPLEQARREVIESKRHIEEKIGKSVTTFSYPNGEPTDFNDDIKEILKENGFTCAVTGAPRRLVTLEADLYELGRIKPGRNLDTLKLSLSGLYPDLKSILRKT